MACQQEAVGNPELAAVHTLERLPWEAAVARRGADLRSQAGPVGAVGLHRRVVGRSQEAWGELHTREVDREVVRTQEVQQAVRMHRVGGQEEREVLPKPEVAVGRLQAEVPHFGEVREAYRAGVGASDLAFAYRVLLLAVVSLLALPVSRPQAADSSETSRSRRCSSSC